jgi:hypothetical protein
MIVQLLLEGHSVHTLKDSRTEGSGIDMGWGKEGKVDGSGEVVGKGYVFEQFKGSGWFRCRGSGRGEGSGYGYGRSEVGTGAGKCVGAGGGGMGYMSTKEPAIYVVKD